MAFAGEYLETFPTTCVFHLESDDSVCAKPAVAVYISADHNHEGRYVCQEHGEEAETEGDGPVFWQRGTPERENPDAEDGPFDGEGGEP